MRIRKSNRQLAKEEKYWKFKFWSDDERQHKKNKKYKARKMRLARLTKERLLGV